jgi:sulfotransferase
VLSPRFHFISGLPRSGSTLLAAILRQNPRFHAGMTSPVGSLFLGMLNQFSAGSEIAPLVSLEQRRRLLRGVFDGYYAEQAGKAVIFDTNRLWCARLPALLDLFRKYEELAFWHDRRGSRVHVITASADSTAAPAHPAD